MVAPLVEGQLELSDGSVGVAPIEEGLGQLDMRSSVVGQVAQEAADLVGKAVEAIEQIHRVSLPRRAQLSSTIGQSGRPGKPLHFGPGRRLA